MPIPKITSHDCCDHYKLRNYEKLFSCDGCKMNGRGRRYQCELCGNELHTDCRFPRTTISHECFPGSIFTFRDEPFTRRGKNKRKEFSKWCDACGKAICGFSYHCEADKLDLHICCRNLQKTLLVSNTVFNLQAKVSKCIWCKKRKIYYGDRINVPGWSYVSTCKEYRFHVYCMMEMVHEACVKNGEMARENIELRKLVKSSRNRGSGNKIFKTIKSVLQIIWIVLLGDPSMLVSGALVELVSRA